MPGSLMKSLHMLAWLTVLPFYHFIARVIVCSIFMTLSQDMLALITCSTTLLPYTYQHLQMSQSTCDCRWHSCFCYVMPSTSLEHRSVDTEWQNRHQQHLSFGTFALSNWLAHSPNHVDPCQWPVPVPSKWRWESSPEERHEHLLWATKQS